MVMWEDARLSTHAMEIKTIKILLVEDNPDDVFFLRMVLHKVTGTHFELHPVKTLAAGLSRLAEGNIDVVLLDSDATRQLGNGHVPLDQGARPRGAGHCPQWH